MVKNIIIVMLGGVSLCLTVYAYALAQDRHETRLKALEMRVEAERQRALAAEQEQLARQQRQMAEQNAMEANLQHQRALEECSRKNGKR